MSTATTPKLDRNGWPCPIAHAIERFNYDGALTEARKKSGYELAHAVARGADELIDRFETIGHTLDAAMEVLSGSSDEDTARAVLEVLKAYRVESANRAFDLAALTMAALEAGKLIERPAVEGGAA